MVKIKNKYYAYLILKTNEQGITSSWSACEKKTKHQQARYKGFKTKEDAQKWLKAGAKYSSLNKKNKTKTPTYISLQDAIYFDAGTGRGEGVEVRLSDKDGAPLLDELNLKELQINKFGNINLGKNVTNNYGELIGCLLAIQLAIKTNQKLIFGDSKLIIDYWSKGRYKKDLPEQTQEKIKITTLLRTQFEIQGGEIKHISGDINPADLGFHK